MTDKEFLHWVADRLVEVHKEPANVDFVLKLRTMADDPAREKPFNNLTPAQVERLAIVAEEMGESLQMVGKTLRHGYESRHPNGGPDNRQNLAMELGHVVSSLDRLQVHDLEPHAIVRSSMHKTDTIKYLHHTPA